VKIGIVPEAAADEAASEEAGIDLVVHVSPHA
jgi:hypothetical protein